MQSVQVRCELLRDPTIPADDLGIEHLVENKDNLQSKGLSVHNGLLAYFDDEGLFKMNVWYPGLLETVI